MMSTTSPRSSRSRSSRSSRLTELMMAASGLRISWAMLAESSPTQARRSASVRFSCSWRARRAVRSRDTAMALKARASTPDSSRAPGATRTLKSPALIWPAARVSSWRWRVNASDSPQAATLPMNSASRMNSNPSLRVLRRAASRLSVDRPSSTVPTRRSATITSSRRSSSWSPPGSGKRSLAATIAPTGRPMRRGSVLASTCPRASTISP